MRTIVRGAIEGARDQMIDFTKKVLGDRTLTDEELVRRYKTEHRGNIDALVAFAQRQAPPGSSPFSEALRYEQRMERLLRAQGG